MIGKTARSRATKSNNKKARIVKAKVEKFYEVEFGELYIVGGI